MSAHSRPASKTNRPLRRAGAAALRLLVAVAVLLGPLQSGARYFYCEGLGLLASDPCARAEHEATDCPAQSAKRVPVDCCKPIVLPTTPDGARAHDERVPAAGVVAIVTAADYVAIGTRGDPGREYELHRVRRPPRSAEERRAHLMVFLT